MKWVEHHLSMEESYWNPEARRATALSVADSAHYAAIVVEKHPGMFYSYNFNTLEFDPIPGVTTMEEAQAVCTALYKMGE